MTHDGAGLDELVVVALIQVFGQNCQLFLNDEQQRLQRPAHRLCRQFVETQLLVDGQRRDQRLQRVQFRGFGRCQQRLRLRERDVARPVHRGQQVEEVDAHASAPRTSLFGSGSSTRISAAAGSSPGVAIGR